MATLAGIVPAERAGQLNQLADKVGRATNTTSTSSKKPKNKNTNQNTSVDDKKLKNICVYLTERLREHRDPIDKCAFIDIEKCVLIDIEKCVLIACASTLCL